MAGKMTMPLFCCCLVRSQKVLRLKTININPRKPGVIIQPAAGESEAIVSRPSRNGPLFFSKAPGLLHSESVWLPFLAITPQGDSLTS